MRWAEREMKRQVLHTLLGGLMATTLVVFSPASSRGTGGTGHLRCDVAPRSFENLTTLVATPPSATPPATTGGDTIETGTPASAAERLEMRNLIERWLACQNEGRLFSAWALFSDAYLYRLISRQPPITESLYEDWATPKPVDDTTATLLEISGERRLSDGRLGATVRIGYASIPMPKQFFFYFVEQDDALLIDSILGEISFSVP
jgi:hypothetical protein